MKKHIILIFIAVIISMSLTFTSVFADEVIDQAQKLLERYSKPTAPPEPNDPAAWDKIMRSKQVGPMVNCMPHYYSWVGREITIWGNVHWGDTTTGDYEWDLGDGTILTGTVTDSRYISVTHIYTTGGVKTATLTVTDGNSEIDTDQTKIDVTPIANKEQRVNAAIEDGLRWLYLNQNASGWWYSTSDANGMGTTGLAVLAFEENAHYGNNDEDEDIYAETVQLGLDWILNTYGRTEFIEEQPAGDPDTDGDSLGVYFGNWPAVYENGIAVLAVAASNQPDSIVSDGDLSGMTYYEVMEDAMNCIAYTQTDSMSGNERGGWRYNAYSANNYGDSDNSAVQWCVLALEAIEKNMPPIQTPQWVKDELAYWLDYSQAADGGFGYTSPTYWENNVKTGAGMASHYWIGTAVSDSTILKALEFLDTHFDDTFDGYTSEMLNGNYYSLYGVKKGFEFYDITTFGAGPRDWYEEISDYLLDNSTYGQNSDGSWPTGTYAITWTHGTTPTSILVLTRGVVQLQPVAVISSSDLPQPTDTPISFSSKNSYHQNPQEYINKWEWDFDASDGVDWNNPDAIGEFVTWQYATEDTFHVTLRVTSSDSLTDTDVHTTIVNDGVDHAPIADPGGPYAARPGDIITLDGSDSYDPDGDPILGWDWDTDGDGEYDDASGETTQVVFGKGPVYNGLVGLRVTTATAVSDTTAPNYVTLWTSNVDLELTDNNVSVSNSNPNMGESITFTATVDCNTDESEIVPEFILRFYDGNPTISVNPIGEFTLGPMGNGDDKTVTLNWTMPDTLEHDIYIIADADGDVEEYDENNNQAIISLGGAQPPDGEKPYFRPNPYDPNEYTGEIFPNFDDPDSPISEIKIYDVAGNLVLDMDDNISELEWNGRNEFREMVANGVYYIVIENEAGEKVIIKVAVLR